MAREPDPPTQLRGLARGLAGKEPLARAYLFRGDEAFFRAEGVRIVSRAAEARGLELARHDAQDPDFALARLLDDLSAAPMFAAARCVTLLRAASLLKPGAPEAEPLARRIEAFLASGSPPGALVLDAEGLRADHALAKRIAGAGGVLVACRRLYDSPPPWGSADPRRTEIVVWLGERAREKEVRLGPDEALALVAATGNDLAALDLALERLRYQPGPGARDLEKVAGREAAPSPWALAEHLCQGDVVRCLGGVEALFRVGFRERDGMRVADPAALVAMLLGSARGKVTQALAGARALAEGAGAEEAARRAGVAAWPAARAEFDARLRSRPAADWPRLLSDLLDLERRTRRSTTVDASDLALLALRWKRSGEAGRGLGQRAAAR